MLRALLGSGRILSSSPEFAASPSYATPQPEVFKSYSTLEAEELARTKTRLEALEQEAQAVAAAMARTDSSVWGEGSPCEKGGTVAADKVFNVKTAGEV